MTRVNPVQVSKSSSDMNLTHTYVSSARFAFRVRGDQGHTPVAVSVFLEEKMRVGQDVNYPAGRDNIPGCAYACAADQSVIDMLPHLPAQSRELLQTVDEAIGSIE